MRLVGATRWFIRWPFMIEGVVVGFAGGLVAILILWLGKITIVDPLSKHLLASWPRRTPARSPSRCWSRSSSPPRCWSRRSAPASRCGASSRSEAAHEGRADRGPVGRPARRALRRASGSAGTRQAARASSATRFVGASGGLTAEATELIQDNYYRAGRPDRAGQLLAAGHGAAGCASSFHDRFSDYFSPQNLKRFNEEIDGRFSGIGLAVTEVKRGLRADHVFHGSPAQRAGIEVGDVIVSVDGDSIAGESSEAATAKIKGPGRHRGRRSACCDPPSGKVAPAAADPRPGRAADHDRAR